MFRTFRSVTLSLVAGLTLVSCGGSESPSDPVVQLVIEILSGGQQQGTVGQAVTTPPSVRVRDDSGQPQSGVAVTFSVASGGGTVSGSSRTTGADGTAAVGSWILGETAGPQSLNAAVVGAQGSPVTFTAQAAPGAAAQASVQAGDNQSAPIGTGVATAPSVRVTDSFGNPVSGVRVAFAVTSGGGVVNGSSVTTGADGIAAVVVWQLGPNVGANTLTATVDGSPSGSPIVFTATGTAGPPASLQKVAGDGQTVEVSTAVLTNPSVKVTDFGGNPVVGVEVTFAVTGGGGTVEGGTQSTGSDGVATVGSWTLGAVQGENTLQASISGAGVTGNPATFKATGLSSAPASIAIEAGNGQSAEVGTAVQVAPSVKVLDDQGEPVEKAAVTFAVTSGGGSVTGGAATTNASGIATVGSWILGPTGGQNTLTAAVQGNGVSGNPVTFTATAIDTGPASVEVVAGNGQSAPLGTSVPVAPSVRVRDAQGDLVGGATVTFAVASGGGSVTGATATTGADGVATVGSWSLGPAVGQNTLTATVQGNGVSGNPVTFTATAIDTGPASVEVVAGNGQSAVVGTPVPVAPSVRVRDAQGDLVGGATVTFAVVSGGGSVTGATATTGADGIATVGSWTLGASAGANSMTATVSGNGITGNPITFSATATPPQPAAVAISAGNGQVVINSMAVQIAPAVVVTDAGGNPVAGVMVTFAVASGGGSVTGGTATTNASGIATVGSWTLGSSVGTNTLTATVSGSGITGNPVTFTATAALNPADMAGTWTGSWNNTTFGSSGSSVLTITVDQTNMTVEITMDLGGNVFGSSDPAPETATGSYSTSGFTLSRTSTTIFGTGTIEMSPTGEVTIVSNNLTSGIARIETTGTVTATQMTGQSTITFTGGGTASATTTMTRQ